jgi:DNA primase
MNQSFLDWIQDQFPDGRIINDDYVISCPFCGEQSGHMYVSMIKQVAHCFRCEWGGSLFDFAKQFLDADSFAEVWQLIREKRTHLKDFDDLRQRLLGLDKQMTEDITDMPDWYVPFSADAKQDKHAQLVLGYALKRLSANNIIKYGIGYCDDPKQDMFRLRMILPIERGYFQARTIGKTEPKYTNPKVPVGNRVFNSTALNGTEVLIAEGVISAIAIGTKAVAVLGKNVRKEQLERIAKCPANKVTISFDSDASWGATAVKAADYLYHCGKKVYIRQYLEGDPDSSDIFSTKRYSLLSQLSQRWEM